VVEARRVAYSTQRYTKQKQLPPHLRLHVELAPLHLGLLASMPVRALGLSQSECVSESLGVGETPGNDG